MTDEPSPAQEEWQIQRDHLKCQGDAHFRSRSYPQAIACYHSALLLDPTDHVLLSNKSAAHLAHGEKSKALHEARRCVECAPEKWVKGHTRLAAAMASLGRYGEALEVYERVLREMDAESEVAKRGAEECRAMMERRRREHDEEEEEAQIHKEMDRDKSEKETNDGDDLLDDFFSQVERVSEKPKQQQQQQADSNNNTDDEESKTNRIKIHLNDLGTSASQIDRLLQTNYEWKNLNPYYVLDIPHTLDDESILSARYRALSLLVHPDKNPHDADRAKAAFEQVRKAMNQLNDETKRNHLRALMEQGHKQGRRDWEEAKRTNNVSGGGMDAEDDERGLLAAQKKATMKIFAEIEAKRRDVERRKRKYEQRERAQEDEEKEKEKNEREHDRRWREMGRVEKRVGNWRDFQMGGKKA